VPELQEIPTGVAVVGAILIDRAGRVLMRRRPAEKRYGGLWEFPGGKVEPGEAHENALVREISEELGVALDPAALRFALVSADNAQGALRERDPHVLFLYTCRRWSGEPRCLEGGAVGWFDAAAAAELPVPPLDVAPVQRLAEIVARAGA